MFNEDAINRKINVSLIAENEEREANHESSGKLSASRLNDPERYWILKHLGIPRKDLDGFTLRKFARGRAVEDWYVSRLKKIGVLKDEQKLAEYKGAVGYVDAIVDHDQLDGDFGVIPHEVKSVTNAHFKRITKTNDVNHHYHLQAAFYALSEGSKHYAIDIIASDDMRILPCVFETAKMKAEIDQIIDRYNQVIQEWEEMGVLPEWEPKAKWQDNPMYQNYESAFLHCSADELRRFIKKTKGA